MTTRKGISPLIATLLLIAIAVAASVLTYSWVMSMVSSQSAQAQTQVRIDSVNWHGSGTAGTTFELSIRNTGSVAATIEAVSIRENKAGSTTYTASKLVAPEPFFPAGTGLSFDTGVAGPLVVNWNAWVRSTSYVVRVTTTTGFYYESVVTSPAAWPAS